MGNTTPIELLRSSLDEFRTVDIGLSSEAQKASDILTRIIEESQIAFSPEESLLINNLREQYIAIGSEPDLWKDILGDIQNADSSKIAIALENINNKLGNPEANAAYKKRLRACFTITQNYLRLSALLRAKQTPRINKQENDGLIIFGAIQLNEFDMTTSLARPFQFLPRQVLFAGTWSGYVKAGSLDDCVNAVESLERKYKRATRILNQTLKAVETFKDTFIQDSAIISHVNNTATTQVLETTPLKKMHAITASSSTDLPQVVTSSSAFATPRYSTPEIGEEKNLDDTDIDEEINDMLEFSTYESSDRGSVDSTFLLNDFDTQLARLICKKSEDLASPLKSKEKAFRPIKTYGSPIKQPDFDSIDTENQESAKASLPEEPSKDEIAKQAIDNLRNTLSSSHRPTLFGGGRRHRIENGRIIKVPYHEKKMRHMLDSFTRQKMDYYHSLASDVLNVAIEAESNKPFFNTRSTETSTFYGNMFETLGVNVGASLENIKQFIEGKGKKYWGTRIDKRPTTVNKILLVINDKKKDAIEKLKEVIHMAQVAAETNGELSLFKWRSQNTEKFYRHFTHCFIKLDNSLINKAYVEGRSVLVDHAEETLPRRPRRLSE